MDSTNIDLLTARLTQIDGILAAIDPACENSALWAVQELLDQAYEAANKLWEQGIASHKAMAENAV